MAALNRADGRLAKIALEGGSSNPLADALATGLGYRRGIATAPVRRFLVIRTRPGLPPRRLQVMRNWVEVLKIEAGGGGSR